MLMPHQLGYYVEPPRRRATFWRRHRVRIVVAVALFVLSCVAVIMQISYYRSHELENLEIQSPPVGNDILNR